MAQGKLLVPTDKDRAQVEALSGYGLPFAQIAAIICDGIDEDTLTKHFKTELVSGKAKANSMVGKTLYQKATGGDTAAMIWWSKTQMGWKESNVEKFIMSKKMSGLTLDEQRQTISDACLNGEIDMKVADAALGILVKSRTLMESDEIEKRLIQLEQLAIING